MDVASAHQTFAAEKLRLCFIWVGQKPCDHLEVAVTALLAYLAPLNAPGALTSPAALGPWAPAPPRFLVFVCCVTRIRKRLLHVNGSLKR